MSVATRIRKLGFRRWHERQLIEAHASLVTALLAVIAVAVCLDQFRWRESGVKPLIMLVLTVVGIALCFKTVTYYFKVLFRAEHFARQAVCEGCKTYGVIDVLAASHHTFGSDDDEWLKVHCRECHFEWTISGEHHVLPAGKSL